MGSKRSKGRKKPQRASSTRGGGLRETLIKAARWPVIGAFVSSDWKESGSAGLILLREHPGDGRIMAAMFYVDLWCMGVKNAHAQLEDDPRGLLESLEESGVSYEPCAPELVAAIVEAGASFASGLGLRQDPDLLAVQEMLRGLDPSKVEPVVAGYEGQPLYIPGPDDDVPQVLHTLERALGPEGFRAMRQRMEAMQREAVPTFAFDPAPGLLQRAASDDALLHEALLRCGTLKEALVAFGRQLGVEERTRGTGGRLDVLAFDLELLTGPSPAGEPVLEAFLSQSTGLDEAERALIHSWSDPVVGVFRVLERDASRLVLDNYVDDQQYTVWSNLGLGAMEQLPPFDFLLTALVPGPRGWLLSGVGTPLPDEKAALEVAWQLAASMPRQTQRNPDIAQRTREHQLQQHEAFVAHFGADEVIVAGAELAAVMEGWRQDQHARIVERAAREGDALPEGWSMPTADVSALTRFPSVGLLSDPEEGMSLLPRYGEFRASFENPDEADLEVVEGFLDADSIGPLPFQRMARAFPEATDRLLARVTGQADFRWERDEAALLQQRKPRWRPRPPVTMLPQRLSDWKLRR